MCRRPYQSLQYVTIVSYNDLQCDACRVLAVDGSCLRVCHDTESVTEESRPRRFLGPGDSMLKQVCHWVCRVCRFQLRRARLERMKLWNLTKSYRSQKSFQTAPKSSKANHLGFQLHNSHAHCRALPLCRSLYSQIQETYNSVEAHQRWSDVSTCIQYITIYDIYITPGNITVKSIHQKSPNHLSKTSIKNIHQKIHKHMTSANGRRFTAWVRCCFSAPQEREDLTWEARWDE